MSVKHSMKAETKVKIKHPEAQVEERNMSKPRPGLGRNYFIVFATPWSSIELGIGKTASDAWADAYYKLNQ